MTYRKAGKQRAYEELQSFANLLDDTTIARSGSAWDLLTEYTHRRNPELSHRDRRDIVAKALRVERGRRFRK